MDVAFVKDEAMSMGHHQRRSSGGLGLEAGHSAASRFRSQPSAPGQARRFLAGLLDQWGVRADGAEIVLSELATNAVLHARSDFSVTVSEHGGTLRITVGDASPQVPERPMVDASAFSGRGLALVEGLATAWGVAPRAGGKEVWAELATEKA